MWDPEGILDLLLATTTRFYRGTKLSVCAQKQLARIRWSIFLPRPVYDTLYHFNQYPIPLPSPGTVDRFLTRLDAFCPIVVSCKCLFHSWYDRVMLGDVSETLRQSKVLVTWKKVVEAMVAPNEVVLDILQEEVLYYRGVEENIVGPRILRKRRIADLTTGGDQVDEEIADASAVFFNADDPVHGGFEDGPSFADESVQPLDSTRENEHPYHSHDAIEDTLGDIDGVYFNDHN